MRTKEIRPSLNPETCAVCGRRLLQGELQTRFVAPDGVRHVVCELCLPRAERARWVREREGEQPLGPRPTPKKRSGRMRRMIEWFGGAEQEESVFDEELDLPVEPESEADDKISPAFQPRARERQSRLPKIELPPLRESHPPERGASASPRRDVTAVPTGEEAKLQRGLELFNHSQFPRTIAGLTRSLGLPQVAILHAGGNSVEIFVAWGISWYSYRVDLGDSTEPVELSGRGNDSAELDDVVGEWNVMADEGGILVLKLGAGPVAASEVAESSQTGEESQETSNAPTEEEL